MAMLLDLIQKLMSGEKPMSGDNNEVTPDMLMNSQNINSDPRNIRNDKGDIVDYDMKDWGKGNPFADAIAKSRSNNDSGPGVLRQLVDSFMGGSGVVPNTGTVGGGGPPDHVPGTRQDAALNPAPMKSQRQPNLAATTPAPLPTPPDYSMPQALDPQSIEELRISLLTDAGQLDPNNPNGLSGRMNSPNASVDQRGQMGDVQRQHDSLRGFDGTRAQRIKDSNNGGQ